MGVQEDKVTFLLDVGVQSEWGITNAAESLKYLVHSLIDFVSVCVCVFAARVRRNVKGESRVAKIG